jgi:membrane-associated phospholipid phosphatase
MESRLAISPSSEGISFSPSAPMPDDASEIRSSRGRRWRTLVIAAAFLGAAAAALPLDCRLSGWCVEGRVPGDIRRLLTWSESFGHGLGVALIALALFQLDPLRRRTLPRVLAASLGAGLAADVVKLLVARSRPYRAFELHQGLIETFGGWFPLGRGGSSLQSFPSAHTATAIGLALALAWLYPRGRWLFAGLAVLVACQRLQCGAHFLSDVLAGAAVGWLAASAFLPGGFLAGGFDRFEQRGNPIAARPSSVENRVPSRDRPSPEVVDDAARS